MGALVVNGEWRSSRDGYPAVRHETDAQWLAADAREIDE
jgi:hypothetical protein